MTKQRRWQIKMQEQGRCMICGQPAVDRFNCQKHLEANRERARNRYRRNAGIFAFTPLSPRGRNRKY